MLNWSHLEVISPPPPLFGGWFLDLNPQSITFSGRHFALGIIQNEYIGLVLFCHGELATYVWKMIRHYKKTILLQWAKTAAKGPFDLSWRVLLRQFYIPVLRCRNSSIAVVTKNATINAPFSGLFGFLRRAENGHHMRLEFMSIYF